MTVCKTPSTFLFRYSIEQMKDFNSFIIFDVAYFNAQLNTNITFKVYTYINYIN